MEEAAREVARTIVAMARSCVRQAPTPAPEYFWAEDELVNLLTDKIIQIAKR